MKIAALILALCTAGGCKLIPDSVNYTYASDFSGAKPTHYFGASWDIPKGPDK